MSSPIPPLLEPYLALPPEAALILLTNILGASSNWLVLRFIHSALMTQDVSTDLSTAANTKVLLVSFMRDLAFWKENGRKLGLDLDKLAAKKKFAFVDGLSGLFIPKQNVRLNVGEKILSNPDLGSVAAEIQKAVQTLEEGGKVLLVVDQLDLLLAAGGNHVGAVDVADMILGVRELVYATVITVSADYPFVSAQKTPLELDHAAFLLSVAHQADFIMSLRLLDSGTARDVSGVVRITAGDQNVGSEEDIQARVEEKELLYFVGGDGGVKVFERGQ